MMPWYIPYIVALVAAWHYAFYEILILGLLMDLAFDSAHFFTVYEQPFTYPFLILSAAALVVLQSVKKRVRFYA